MITHRPISVAACVAALLLWLPASSAQEDLPSLIRRAQEAMQQHDYDAAKQLFAEIVTRQPGHPYAHYHLACALSRLNELDAATEALRVAIVRGFVDFHHMDRDENLDAIREHPKYVEIIASWRELLDLRGQQDIDKASAELGRAYRTGRDERLRIHYITVFNDESFEAARREVERVAAYAYTHLFPEPDASDPRPDPWVTVVLPTPEDFTRFVPVASVGGSYDHPRRTLVARDIGPTLRHEFLHVLHHRRMDRLGQAHAYWVQEGLGALVEDMSDDNPRGTDAPVPSWRTNIARRLAVSNSLTPWERLFALDRTRYITTRASANYAQSRAIFMDIERRGALQEWTREYEQTFDEDPTGALAMLRTLGKTIDRLQREHRAWLRTLPEVADSFQPAAATLGAVFDEGVGDGVVVREVVSRPSGVGEERLRPRDVVLSVNGAAVRSLAELERVLTGLAVGETARVDVRRGSVRLEFDVPLVER